MLTIYSPVSTNLNSYISDVPIFIGPKVISNTVGTPFSGALSASPLESIFEFGTTESPFLTGMAVGTYYPNFSITNNGYTVYDNIVLHVTP